MKVTGDKRHSYFHYKRGYIAMVSGKITSSDPDNPIFTADINSFCWKQHPHLEVTIDDATIQDIIQIVQKQQSETTKKHVTIVFE